MTYSIPLIITGIAFLGLGCAIGVRLLLLARRTRQLPELLMGLAFLVGGCFGYVLEVLSQDGAIVPEQWALPAWLVGRLCVDAGVVMTAGFTAVVFRPGSPWARAAVYGLAGMFALSIMGQFLGLAPVVAFEIESAARFVAPIWGGCEALRFYLQMRRRVRLGLADPIVANRFALWSLAQAAAFVGLATRVLDAHDVFVEVAAVMMPAAGLATTMAYWLTFFPPSFYRRWLSGGDEGEVAHRD